MSAPTVTEKLKALRIRAGLSMKAMALVCGLKGASSYQRYENTALFKEESLPLPMARKLATAMEGRGLPPISIDEVYALAGVTVTDGVTPVAVIHLLTDIRDELRALNAHLGARKAG